MSELADDTEEFARKIANSEDCVERFEEVFQRGMDEDMTPEEHVDYVVDTLTDEFIREDDNIQNDVPGFGELLEKTFERVIAEKFQAEVERRQDFLDHIQDLSQKLSNN